METWWRSSSELAQIRTPCAGRRRRSWLPRTAGTSGRWRRSSTSGPIPGRQTAPASRRWTLHATWRRRSSSTASCRATGSRTGPPRASTPRGSSATPSNVARACTALPGWWPSRTPSPPCGSLRSGSPAFGRPASTLARPGGPGAASAFAATRTNSPRAWRVRPRRSGRRSSRPRWPPSRPSSATTATFAGTAAATTRTTPRRPGGGRRGTRAPSATAACRSGSMSTTSAPSPSGC
mmetsp:Transcript_46458/g.145640  ORF Transcript_46458/g.145640 Transcript_46458/m.145640 type:complete len:236 (-) Transcript_46458:520-1227(-)